MLKFGQGDESADTGQHHLCVVDAWDMHTAEGVVRVAILSSARSSGARHWARLRHTATGCLVDQGAAGVEHVLRFPVCCSPCFYIFDSLHSHKCMKLPTKIGVHDRYTLHWDGSHGLGHAHGLYMCICSL